MTGSKKRNKNGRENSRPSSYKEKKYSVLYGFRGADDMDTVGFVSLDSEVGITESIEEAALFERENYSGVSGWGSPDDWAAYFGRELEPWVFHPVPTSRTKENT